MGATTTEGTGAGSVTLVRPPILNGVVKAENIDINDLIRYQHDIHLDGSIVAGKNITASGYIHSDSYINAIGDITASGIMNATGSITSSSYIRGAASGQLVNTYVANISTGNATTSGTNALTLATVNYTPVSSVPVNIFIEFHADYSVSGSGAGAGDSFQSTINVNNTPIAYRTQHWGSASGTGTRSGVLFPIAVNYQQTGTTYFNIAIKVQRTLGDDASTIYVNGSDPATIRISEYIA